MMHIARWFTLIFLDHTMYLGFHDAHCKMGCFHSLDHTMYLGYHDKHKKWFTWIHIDHSMSLGFQDSYCKMFYFDSLSIQCILDIIKHIARMFTLICKRILYFITHIAIEFTFILIPYTKPLGFHNVYCRMVYFDTHRPYTVSWNS